MDDGEPQGGNNIDNTVGSTNSEADERTQEWDNKQSMKGTRVEQG